MLHILGHLAGRSLLLHKCQACLCNLQLLQAYKAPLDEIVNPCKWLIFIEIPLSTYLWEKIIKSSCNLLSFFYSHIYLPTYTNGLKEIATFLGFQWTADNASGLQSIDLFEPIGVGGEINMRIEKGE